jgi:DNA-binding winged helix-turn-helix (wHTH) protein
MSAVAGKEIFEFGPFRVDPEKQRLLRGQEPIALTPKTFQLLLALVRRGNEVVTKDELMKSVWPETFVEETNLTRNIFALRKALEETEQNRYIITVPGRGYRLADIVHLVPEAEISIAAARLTTVQVHVAESKPWAWIAAGLMAVSPAQNYRPHGKRHPCAC